MDSAATNQFLRIALQHHQAGRLSQAEQIYRQILARQPAHADALHFLGVINAQKGRHGDAVDLIGRAIAFKPRDADALYNLGKALRAVGRLEESIAAYRRAIVLDPGSSEIRNNLGVALQANGQLDEAVDVFRQATELPASTAEAHNNLGSLTPPESLMRPSPLTVKPLLYDPATPRHIRILPWRYSRGGISYQLGMNTSGGWKCAKLTPDRRAFVQPEWDGRPLEGATILLRAEQGFGDAIQFIRYMPLVARRGGNIVVECQKELQRLVQSAAADSKVLARGEPLPPFDLHCSLMGLPRLFGTTIETIPRRVPYLTADLEKTAQWRERLASASDSLKVGLAWAGSKTNTKDRERSIPLSALAPLAGFANVRFHSLQKGKHASLLSDAPAGLEITDWTEELKDFADTAALMCNLDLIISVDTAVAHLAGALGKTTWVLLSSAPHWCWLVDREDSPWYPTARLFRQTKKDDWQSVVERVADALTQLVEDHIRRK